MFCGCSERSLGFSGYSDDDKESFANPGVATSTRAADRQPVNHHTISSDINSNPLKNPQIDGNSAQQRSSSSSNGKQNQQLLSSETKRHDRQDENRDNQRHDTPSQVRFLLRGLF